jgi:hypothetical protein
VEYRDGHVEWHGMDTCAVTVRTRVVRGKRGRMRSTVFPAEATEWLGIGARLSVHWPGVGYRVGDVMGRDKHGIIVRYREGSTVAHTDLHTRGCQIREFRRCEDQREYYRTREWLRCPYDGEEDDCECLPCERGWVNTCIRHGLDEEARSGVMGLAPEDRQSAVDEWVCAHSRQGQAMDPGGNERCNESRKRAVEMGPDRSRPGQQARGSTRREKTRPVGSSRLGETRKGTKRKEQHQPKGKGTQGGRESDDEERATPKPPTARMRGGPATPGDAGAERGAPAARRDARGSNSEKGEKRQRERAGEDARSCHRSPGSTPDAMLGSEHAGAMQERGDGRSTAGRKESRADRETQGGGEGPPWGPNKAGRRTMPAGTTPGEDGDEQGAGMAEGASPPEGLTAAGGRSRRRSRTEMEAAAKDGEGQDTGAAKRRRRGVGRVHGEGYHDPGD